MPKEFTLPALGEEVEEGDIVSILVSEGDTIEADQNVVEVESDKATVEVPCPFGGRISKIHIAEGDHVKVGQKLLTVDTDGKAEKAEEAEADEEGDSEEAADETEAEKAEAPPEEGDGKKPSRAKKKSKKEKSAGEPEAREADRKKKPDRDKKEPPEAPEEEAEAPEEEPERKETQEEPDTAEAEVDREPRGYAAPPAAPTPSPAASIPAGPATRRLARELGVDLQAVAEANPDARLTEEHVKEFVKQRLAEAPARHERAAPGVEIPELPDFSQWGPVDRVAQSSLAKRTARRMSAAWAVAPQVTHVDAADVTLLEAMLARYVDNAGDDEPKLTITALAIKACVHALKQFPKFNASLDAAAGQLILKHYYHIGVAVDTEAGLIVPVIRDCDRKSVLEIASELVDLADRARRRKTKPDELRGSSFTITNVGGIGGVSFSPIINYPEVAILGLARTYDQAIVEDGELVSRPVLPVCVSYDHRVINGADAARFTRFLVELFEDPDRLLLRG